jgi:NarL family two-component system sensor histidine kinase YdfH
MRTRSLPKPEQDYRIFFVVMTVIMIGMYILSLAQNPALRQPGPAVLFTLLIVLHIALHWILVLYPTFHTPFRRLFYILGQGLLALIITYLSQNIGMVFALYMGLIGEVLGFLGVNRWSILAALYYLSLSLINFLLFGDMGGAVYWMLTVIPIVIFVGLYVTLYLRQAEAREKAQALAEELESANRQLTEYAAQVEDLTIAGERQRMARELHDTLSQGLAGLILQLEAADAYLASNHPEKARSIIENSMSQARLVLANARRAIDDLRQPKMEDLDSALRLEVSRFTNATGIPVRLHTDPTPSLPDPVKETIVRAVAEALTNIAQHARAKNVEVELGMKGGGLSVTVGDDGVGFDPSSIPSGHYGVLGICERVRMTNGSVNIHSNRGNGTTLNIQIPLTPFPLSSPLPPPPQP